jgi:RHS repeat-associated protein
MTTTRPAACAPLVRFSRYLFTGKERDAESGNDYFGARYYASSMGRFMSPDWSAKVMPVPYAKLDDPQTLNLYSYVQNNPLRSVDADGHAGDIAVIEDGPTQGNPIGHTAIAITGKGVFSFGTAERDGSLTKLGGSTTDFLQNQTGRRDQTITIIKTTPAQDQAAADALMKQDAKGSINTYPDNCSARSNAGLDAAGIPQANVSNPITPMPADPSMPGTAGARAMDTPGSQTITIPKGGAVPSQMNQFNPAPGAPAPKTPNTNKQQGSS